MSDPTDELILEGIQQLAGLSLATSGDRVAYYRSYLENSPNARIALEAVFKVERGKEAQWLAKHTQNLTPQQWSAHLRLKAGVLDVDVLQQYHVGLDKVIDARQDEFDDVQRQVVNVLLETAHAKKQTALLLSQLTEKGRCALERLRVEDDEVRREHGALQKAQDAFGGLFSALPARRGVRMGLLRVASSQVSRIAELENDLPELHTLLPAMSVSRLDAENSKDSV